MGLKEDLEKFRQRRDEVDEVKAKLDVQSYRLGLAVELISEQIKATETLLLYLERFESIEGLENVVEESRTLLARAISILLSPVVSTPEVSEPSPAPEATTSPGGRRSKRIPRPPVEKFGVWPTASTILRVAFTGQQYPDTLEKALTKAFGLGWSRKIFSVTARDGGHMVAFAEDLEKGRGSEVRRRLTQTMLRMDKIRKGQVPEGTSVPRGMEVLYDEIKFAEKADEIIETVKGWGLDIAN